jgi:signal transduction histidine kinase/CheY-like chemotaxis protein
MKRPPSDPPDELRRKAVERLGGAPSTTTDASRLLHELEIHQVELEMQNEHLRVAQNELEATVDRYTQLFDFAPIGYTRVDPGGFVLEINHVGARLLDEQRSRIIGKRFALFLEPKFRQDFAEFLDDVLEDDNREPWEAELVRTTLDRPCVRFTASALAGQPTTVLLAFEDVTAKRRVERRLRQADAELREANHRKDDFLAVLSHELRTPLSSLLMHAQLLRQGGLDERSVVHSGEVIERAAKAQTRLIEDLLDVSRIVAGKLSLTHDEVDLQRTMQAALDSVSAEARKKKIQIEVNVDPNVAILTGDSNRLLQAVQNLLANAVKFTPEEGRVRLTLDEVDQHVRIEVSDTGAGIEADLLPLIFVRFMQADATATRTSGGLGLGLSIASSIVEAHGGSIRAESEGPGGRGSTFTILLPRGDAIPAGPPSPPVQRAETDIRLEGARLLVVEDDELTRTTLTEVLARAGATVREADSGETAMKIFGRFKPDLLVCDIAMPKEDGCSLLKRIRARGPKRNGNVTAIALTAFADETTRDRTRDAGFQKHMAKPVDIDQLIATVSDMLPLGKTASGGTR